MSDRTPVLGCYLAVLVLSCAANVAPARNDVGVTSLQGSDVGGSPAEAWSGVDTAESHARPQGPVLDPRATPVANALAGRDFTRVLSLTEKPSTAPEGAWLDYDRAVAFTGLGRTDEAVEVFRRAEARFRETGDDAARAVSMWGRARALSQAGRCPEAREAYEEYQAAVRLSDPQAAEMAARYAGECRTIVLR